MVLIKPTSATHATLPKKLVGTYQELFDKKITMSSLQTHIAMLTEKQIDILSREKPSFYLYNVIPEKRDRDDTMTIPFGRTTGLQEYLTILTGQFKFSLAIKTAIAMLCYLKSKPPSSNTRNDPVVAPLNVMGNKEWVKTQYLDMLKELKELKNINKCVDLFGGSGFLTLLVAQQCPQYSCTYNDDDMDKQIFFECLRKKPYKLKMRCRVLLDGGINVPQSTAGEDDKITRAAIFWYNLKPKRHAENIATLDQFPYLSKILTENAVIFREMDALKCLKKYMHDPGILIIVDPPYLYTRGYEDRNTTGPREFGDDEYKELSEMLLKTTGIFIFHCRLTGPKSYSKSQAEQNTEKDNLIKGKIEDLFMDKGLFYKMIPYGKNGTIECIISNFHFNGFEPFSSK